MAKRRSGRPSNLPAPGKSSGPPADIPAVPLSSGGSQADCRRDPAPPDRRAHEYPDKSSPCRGTRHNGSTGPRRCPLGDERIEEAPLGSRNGTRLQVNTQRTRYQLLFHPLLFTHAPVFLIGQRAAVKRWVRRRSFKQLDYFN